jgi:hypothetical protein
MLHLSELLAFRKVDGDEDSIRVVLELDAVKAGEEGK